MTTLPAEIEAALAAIALELRRLAAAGMTGPVTVHFQRGRPRAMEATPSTGPADGWRLPIAP